MTIQRLKTIASTGTADNSFVGIKIKDNQIEFHYPETYVLANDDKGLRKDIISILRSIGLAGKKSKSTSSYYSEFNNGVEYPLNSYLWILNDYLKYGRYVNKEKVFEINTKGKINWKRTLRNDPVISNGNIIYTSIIYERNNQIDNDITEAYNCCVKVAIDQIGWLYNISFDPKGIDYNKLFLIKNKAYLSSINTELSKTYEDTKRIRLQHMRNIIAGVDNKMINTKEYVYGVDSYEMIYEAMIDRMFSNIDSIKEFYPKATWELVTEKEERDSTNLRPDTIMIKDHNVYIIDAKYYRFGTTFSISDTPGSDSIQKQITYGEYIKKIYKGRYDEIYSAFIMPYSRTKNLRSYNFNKVMEFMGIAKAKWFKSNKEKNRNVVVILLDTNYLINNWMNKNEDNMNNLIDLIQDSLRGRIIEDE